MSGRSKKVMCRSCCGAQSYLTQPTATELYQLLLYGSETVFHAAYHIYCVTSRLLLSLEDILLRTLVTRNYCCHAREVTMSFMDTLIALT